MSLDRPTTLDDLLNYRLTRLLALSSAPVIRLCEGRFGISRREWRVLALLAAHGAMSPSGLADAGDLDRARTSRAITVLAGKRLVTRTARPGDARRAEVALTAEGRALYDALFPEVARINEALVAALAPAALAAFDAALGALTARAAEVNRERWTELQADRRHGGTRRRWPAAR
jgi:DNA-binding MarR family transcriptional regulator